MSDLSVVISAYDQHEMTVEHVKGCMNSSVIIKDIVVVNDGGDPSLLEMLKNVPNRTCPITYARITKDIPWNQQGARNLGVWLSTGKYIAVEDNDHIPDYNFYEQAISLLDDNVADYIVPKTRGVVDFEDVKANPKNKWKVLKTRGKAIIISTCRRELLVDTKVYDESFSGRYGWEIPEWEARVKQTGARILCSGRYFTIANAYSRLKDREHDGRQFKMDPINYHHSRRSMREKRTQNPTGILNFQYEVCRF